MATIIARKYEIISQLGQGGMGVVYKVRHSVLETTLALKMLPSYLMESQDMVTRFYREARVMAQLKHPNIVKVLDIDRDEQLNIHFFVMEYIEGKTLGQYLRQKGPLSLSEVLVISQQVSGALAYAHTHKPPIIHRDIKPANIMIEDHSGRVVLMDFGIAKEVGEHDQTQTGMIVGTLKYAAPEQLLHEPLEGSADIYSLGMVMYEMYTGQQFFAGLDENVVFSRVLDKVQENIPQFSRPTPPAFVELITKAIAKSQTRRFRTAEEFLAALQSCHGEEGDTATLILSTSEPKAKREDAGSDVQTSDEDIEQRIRELEEERQRRLVRQHQTQARAAHERAAHEGAAEWSQELFQQALTQEELGDQCLRKREFSAAQRSYQESIALFDRAATEAKAAVLLRRAERARRSVAEVRTEADHYRARERARTFYGRGLSLQVQAEDLWERQAYVEAAQSYEEAVKFFSDARDLAYREMQKGEAEEARQHANTAKQEAERIQAAELAPGAYQEATTHEQRATAALTHEEFSQARLLFSAAVQQYQRATTQARVEQQRQHAVTLRQQVAAAQEKAALAKVQEDAARLYQTAADTQSKAEALFQARQYADAGRAYEQAYDQYGQAGQEAERIRQHRAVAQARQRVAEAQAQADHVETPERLPQEYAQLQQLLVQAQAAEQQERLREALALYQQVAQRFAVLAQTATQQAAQEQADAARQQVIVAREKVSEQREWAITSWEQAQAREVEAEHAYQTGDYQQAKEHYQRAQEAYEQADREAERTQAETEAVQVQRHGHTARQNAVDAAAPQYAERQFRLAVATLEEADQLFHNQEFRQARQSYQHASTLFTQAAEDARREQAQQAASTLRQRWEEAREAALQAGAATRFAQEFAQAERLGDQGQTNERQQQFTHAVTYYGDAAAQLLALRDKAVLAAERERAESACQHMTQVKQFLAPLTAWQNATWSEAQQLEANAEQLRQAGRYPQATEQYSQAAQRYEAARIQAEQDRSRHEATEAKQQMGQARADAEQAQAAEHAEAIYQQALQTQRRAELEFGNIRWQEAREEFLHANVLFDRARQESLQVTAQQRTVMAAQRLAQARQEAEHYGAHKRFAQQFAQAQQFGEQGHQAEAVQQFLQAAEAYEQATQQFRRLGQDAREQAAREGAEQERRRAAERKAQAITVRAYVAVQWDRAEKQEAEAEAAYQAGDYERAAHEYTQATQAYEEANVTGQHEQLRQETLRTQAGELRRRMDAAKAKATPLRQWAVPLWEKAQRQETDAERTYQTGAYERALDVYRQASQTYEEVVSTGEQERARQAAHHTKQQAFAAKEAAEQAKAPHLARDLFARATEALADGDRSLRQDQFTAATEAYGQASLFLQQARDTAQQEQAKQDTASARYQAIEAELRARQAGAAERLSKEFAAAEAMITQAHGNEAQKLFPEAFQMYERARRQFTQLSTEVTRQIARDQAAAAKQYALQAQTEAAPLAPQWAPQTWTEAQEQGATAENAWNAQEYTQAERHYTRARELYERARSEAEEAQCAQQAVEASRATSEARTAAQGAGAQQYADAVYQRAVSLEHRGNEQLTAKQWPQAIEVFSQATALFSEAHQRADRGRTQQAAENARTQARQAQQDAQSARGEEASPGRFAEATSLVRQAEHAFAQGDLRTAHVTFEKSTALFQQVLNDARRYVQKTQTEQAGLRARALWEQAQQLPRRQKRQVDKTLTAGNTLFQQEDYDAAREKYDEVTSLLRSLLTPSEEQTVVIGQLPGPGSNVLRPTSARTPLFMWGGTAAIVIIAGGLYVLSSRSPAPTPPPLAKPSLTPPIITRWEPASDAPVEVAEGEKLTFEVSAKASGQSAQSQPLRYAWYLGDTLQANESRWTYQPGYEEAEDSSKDVKVIVSDGRTTPVEKTWKVRVLDTNRLPSLVNVLPSAGAVEIPVGKERSFTVEATDPDTGESLEYLWSLDGREVARGSQKTWMLPASETATSHQVTVDVLDKSGKGTQVAWNVTAKSAPAPIIEPPRITQAKPATDSPVEVAEGKKLTFEVSAQSTQPQPLRYAWFLGGKLQANGKQWTYQPSYDDAEASPKEVQVVVTDEQGKSIDKTWQVQVQNVNRLPVLAETSPKSREVEIPSGEEQVFTLQARDPDKDDVLAYVWSLDGQEVARDSKSWRLPAAQADKPHKITVDVLDKSGKGIQVTWNVSVKPQTQPPIFTAITPKNERVISPAGQSLEFAATASISGSSQIKQKLTYRWSIDDVPQQAASGQFRFRETTPGTYRLSVVAIGPNGMQSAPHRWTIELQPPPLPSTPQALISEQEARDWLDTVYRQAWEKKDVDTLVQLGEISSQDTAKLKAILAGYKNYSVVFKDINIRNDGNRATVRFTRVDSIDGKSLTFPPQEFTIEKVGDGRITRRR
jgi:serine/threonine-protein kinase